MASAVKIGTSYTWRHNRCAAMSRAATPNAQPALGLFSGHQYSYLPHRVKFDANLHCWVYFGKV